ncbi:hypothetical protein CRG98_043248 [Punica granatum]|uniref:PB1-like domain-containing protein n=1 Tax=Punica granatum TaxID=22663 RepID=A0A2I0HXC6_PUNGR|nr:hypothetical protein CRG98_043248 [Punica granatum]
MAFVPEDEGRFRNEQDVTPLYVEGSQHFTIEYHNGGKFERGKIHTVYVGGELDFADFVSVEYISLLEIDAHVKELGISGFAYYFWTTDVEKLGDSLEKLQTDEDTLKMANQAVREENYVHIYIVTKSAQEVLVEYMKEEQARKVPSNVRIEELEDENTPMPMQRPKDIRSRRRPLLIGWHADDGGLANENMGEEHTMEANRDADKAGDGSVRGGKDRVESSGINATMNDINLEDIDWDDLNLEEIDKLTSSATLNATATSTIGHAMKGQERTGRESVEDIISNFNDSDFDINDDVEQVEANVTMAEGIQHGGEREEADHEAQGGEVQHEEVEGGEAEHEETEGGEAEPEEAEGAWEAGDHGDESDGFQSVHSDDEDETRQRLPEFRPERDMEDPKFLRGMLFPTTKVLKQAVRHYAILNKGLVQSLEELFPNAEKRFCTRHLWKNLCTIQTIKKGKELKDLLWTAAKATYPAEFFRAMEVLKREDEKAWQWLQDKNPSQWWILEARDKPILTLLETIGTQLMKRMVLKRKVAEKYTDHHMG